MSKIRISAVLFITLGCRSVPTSSPNAGVSYRAEIYPDSAVFTFPVPGTSASNIDNLAVYWDVPDLHLYFYAEGVGFFRKDSIAYRDKDQQKSLLVSGGYSLSASRVHDGHAMTREVALVERIGAAETVLILRSSPTLNRLMSIRPDTVRMNVTPLIRSDYATRLVRVEYEAGPRAATRGAIGKSSRLPNTR